jgi:hypothetical protein
VDKGACFSRSGKTFDNAGNAVKHVRRLGGAIMLRYVVDDIVKIARRILGDRNVVTPHYF